MPLPRKWFNQQPLANQQSPAGNAVARAVPNSASQYSLFQSAQQIGRLPPHTQTVIQPLMGYAASESPQQASSGYSSAQRPASVASTATSANGTSASASTTGPQPMATMLLPLSDPFYFVPVCIQCIRLVTRPCYQKLLHAHECLKDLLLVKPVVTPSGSKYIPGLTQAPDQSITRLPADVAKVGPNDWLLVRPRPQTMHSQKRDVFSGNYKFCECFTHGRNCRNGGTAIIYLAKC